MICDRSFDADGSFAYPGLDPCAGEPGVQADWMEGVLGRRGAGQRRALAGASRSTPPATGCGCSTRPTPAASGSC